jgi:two-component system phosphate regulon response regulator PhoB
VPTVLLIEDERDMLTLLDSNLRAAGFETLLAESGEGALAQLRARVPDLVLLDLMLPDVPGAEVCRQIRADPRTRAVPVVICTARSDEIDRVVGFELGADDYVTKPFSMRELVLRLRAVLRRMAGAAAPERPPGRVGPLEIDVDAHRCSIEGVEIELTPIEFRLLATLTARLGRVQPRERLLADVWGNGADMETRTLDTHVKRLREKLGPARDLLETVRGVGYRFADPEHVR